MIREKPGGQPKAQTGEADIRRLRSDRDATRPATTTLESGSIAESILGRRKLVPVIGLALQQAAGNRAVGRLIKAQRVQRDSVPASEAPMSSVASYEAFSAEQRDFLQGVGVEPAGLPTTVAQRMASLLDAVQTAHRVLPTGKAGAGAFGADVNVTVRQTQSDSGGEISTVAHSSGASVFLSRRIDLFTGTVYLQFGYQDVDGNRFEFESKTTGAPRVLERHVFGSEQTTPTISLPQEGYPSPRVPVTTGEETAPSSSPERTESTNDEGVGSFLEGAILGDFGENASWSAIAGQTVIGFVPIAGQIADVRDLLAAVRDVAQGRKGGWLSLGIAAIGFIPGLDFLKGGSRVGRRAMGEAVEESTEALGRLGKHSPKTALSEATTPLSYADEVEAAFKGGRVTSGEILELGGHGSAGKARKVRGQSGYDIESAHFAPQAAMRNLKSYDPNAALTRLLPKKVHRDMDKYWIKRARELRKQGRTSWTAQEMYDVVSESIKRTPTLSDKEKVSHIQRLADEVFVEWRIKPTDNLRLPK